MHKGADIPNKASILPRDAQGEHDVPYGHKMQSRKQIANYRTPLKRKKSKAFL